MQSCEHAYGLGEAIADALHLEPQHFKIMNDDNQKPVAIEGGNIFALAYGKHRIALDEIGLADFAASNDQ